MKGGFMTVDEMVVEYQKNPSDDLFMKIWESQRGRIRKNMSQHAKYKHEEEDFMQEVSIEFMTALKRFDPKKASFGTLLHLYIQRAKRGYTRTANIINGKWRKGSEAPKQPISIYRVNSKGQEVDFTEVISHANHNWDAELELMDVMETMKKLPQKDQELIKQGIGQTRKDDTKYNESRAKLKRLLGM
jgi:RNA polymerase sigma factor (sigma-70 family)